MDFSILKSLVRHAIYTIQLNSINISHVVSGSHVRNYEPSVVSIEREQSLKTKRPPGLLPVAVDNLSL